MVQRINVSLPDDLFEKIQKYKNEMNLSGIFQEAVAAKVAKKEEYQNYKQKTGGKKKMEQIAERLKREKDRFETGSYDDGKKVGYSLAQTLSYEELQYVINTEDANAINVGEDKYFSEYFKEAVFDEGLFEKRLVFTADGHYTDCFEDWLNGWIDGVKDFWIEVEDLI